MADSTRGNLTPFLADHVPRHDPPEIQLKSAMINAGQSPPDAILLDGNLHRYDDQKANGDALWYVAFGGTVPGGAFGSFRSGTHVNWKGDIGRVLSMAEEMAYRSAIESAKQKAEAEKRVRNELAADDSQKIWDSLTAAGAAHPYLARKQVQPHIARADGVGNLVIPMYSPEGELWSLQTITQTGEKRFHKGGRVKGAMLFFGAPSSSAGTATVPNSPIFVAEGFATAATIYETTGTCTVAAFSASNILPVVESLRQSCPASEIVIVADNDKGGVGRNYADQAASKFGARVVMPPEEGQDANDYRAAGGDLLGLLTPPRESWLVSAREFSKVPKPIKWIIKHWIQAEAMIMVHGPSGSGKTFVVLDWCLNMACAIGEWMGNRSSESPIVYLAGEGHNGLRSRVSAWFARNQIPAEIDPPFWLSKSGCDFNTPQGIQLVLSEIRQLPTLPAIIVIDTLHRFLAGDENSSQDVKSMLDACSMIQKEFKCSVLLVHHTGVSEESQHRARGSSAWKGALDGEISIQPPSSKGAAISIIQRKMKDAELADPIFVELVSQDVPGWIDEDGEQVKSAVIIQADEPKKRTSKAEFDARESITKAWQESGEELVNGAPYVTRSAWKECLIRSKTVESEGTAGQYVKHTAKAGFAQRLFALSLISEHENGYLILFPVISRKLTEGGG